MEAEELEVQEYSSSLHNLLGILIPERLSDYVVMMDGGNKRDLVDLMTRHQDKMIQAKSRGKAKILKFEKKVSSKTKVQKGEFSSSDKDDSRNDEKPTSLFILEEKKRLQESQFKLKSKEVLDLYKKSSEVNLSEERSTRDDLSKSNKVGVLINKRQY